MTISTTDSRKEYSGNDVTVAFSFPYLFFTNEDLVVILVDSSDVETIQVLDTDYTVVGAGVDAGGTVTMTTAPATGETLVIYRDPAITQEVDYISGDAFPAETHEQALDRLTMIAQRLSGLLERSLRLTDGVTGFDPTLPIPSAGKTIKFNTAGTAFEIGPDATDIAAAGPNAIAAAASAAAALVSELAAAASAANINLPSVVGDALKFLRVNAGETGYDHLTAAQVLSAISAAGVAISNTFSSAQTFNQTNTYAQQQYFSEVTLTDAASIAWDLALAQEAKVTIAASRTLANPTNQAAGAWYHIRVIQGGTGSYTLSYGTAYKFGTAGAPTLSTAVGAEDVLSFRSNGTNMQYVGAAIGVHA